MVTKNIDTQVDTTAGMYNDDQREIMKRGEQRSTMKSLKSLVKNSLEQQRGSGPHARKRTKTPLS